MNPLTQTEKSAQMQTKWENTKPEKKQKRENTKQNEMEYWLCSEDQYLSFKFASSGNRPRLISCISDIQ